MLKAQNDYVNLRIKLGLEPNILEIEMAYEEGYEAGVKWARENDVALIDRAIEIVQMARSGEIDNDLRSIIYRLERIKKETTE